MRLTLFIDLVLPLGNDGRGLEEATLGFQDDVLAWVFAFYDAVARPASASRSQE
jgi:hypothetical protein